MTSAFDEGRIPPIEVKHRLRIAREYAGLEQEQLAERIGVSRGTIGNAETGRVYPKRILANAWAFACGVPVSWILTGQGPANPTDPSSGLGIISTEVPAKTQLEQARHRRGSGTLQQHHRDRVAS